MIDKISEFGRLHFHGCRLCLLRSVIIATLIVAAASGENLCAGNYPDNKNNCAVTYDKYLSEYESWSLENPESLTTIRPLNEKEFAVIIRAIEFVRAMYEKSGEGKEREFLFYKYRSLMRLIERGRIKIDEDEEERKLGTKMTIHIPSDVSNPFEGDIYVHESGLLEGVSLPLQALSSLEHSELSEDVKQTKVKKCENSLYEGLILLTGYLIHEMRHRSQEKFAGDDKSTMAEKSRYICSIEDPAYSDQYRYLRIVWGLAGPEQKGIIRRTRDALVKEINAKFPHLRGFRELQEKWE